MLKLCNLAILTEPRLEDQNIRHRSRPQPTRIALTSQASRSSLGQTRAAKLWRINFKTCSFRNKHHMDCNHRLEEPLAKGTVELFQKEWDSKSLLKIWAHLPSLSHLAKASSTPRKSSQRLNAVLKRHLQEDSMRLRKPQSRQLKRELHRVPQKRKLVSWSYPRIIWSTAQRRFSLTLMT